MTPLNNLAAAAIALVTLAETTGATEIEVYATP